MNYFLESHRQTGNATPKQRWLLGWQIVQLGKEELGKARVACQIPPDRKIHKLSRKEASLLIDELGRKLESLQ